jgi:hypothetical protein
MAQPLQLFDAEIFGQNPPHNSFLFALNYCPLFSATASIGAIASYDGQNDIDAGDVESALWQRNLRNTSRNHRCNASSNSSRLLSAVSSLEENEIRILEILPRLEGDIV